MILEKISVSKGKERISLENCNVLKSGLENDDKAGKKDREISVYIDRKIDFTDGLCTKKFKANLNISFNDTDRCIKFGSILKIGSAILLVNSVRKKCFSECTIEKVDCYLLENVFYCSVLKEGIIKSNTKVLVYLFA